MRHVVHVTTDKLLPIDLLTTDSRPERTRNVPNWRQNECVECLYHVRCF